MGSLLPALLSKGLYSIKSIILDKQMEVFSKHRKRVELKMIANAAIKHDMIKVDEELGFTNNTK